MSLSVLKRISVSDRSGLPGTITVGLEFIQGNTAPYWTCTAWFGGDRDDSYGGCCHETILDLRPDLAPFVRLHLSDPAGVPMYAVENGWYFMAGAIPAHGERYHAGNSEPPKSPDECLTALANHLRITREEATQIRDECAALLRHNKPGATGAKHGMKAAKEHFAKAVFALHPHWEAEAKAARALLETL